MYCGFRAILIFASLASIKKSLNSPRGKISINSFQLPSVCSKSPKFGIIDPFRMLKAVDFPIPFGPRIPITDSFDKVGKRKSRNPFNE